METRIVDSVWPGLRRVFRMNGLNIGHFRLSFNVASMVRQLSYRIKHGNWHCEVYSFAEEATKWMIPRLEQYLHDQEYEDSVGAPLVVDRDEWITVLEKIIWALKAENDMDFDRKYKVADLEMFINPEDGRVSFDHAEGKQNYSKEDEIREQRIQEGYELLGKYFRSLWW